MSRITKESNVVNIGMDLLLFTVVGRNLWHSSILFTNEYSKCGRASPKGSYCRLKKSVCMKLLRG